MITQIKFHCDNLCNLLGIRVIYFNFKKGRANAMKTKPGSILILIAVLYGIFCASAVFAEYGHRKGGDAGSHRMGDSGKEELFKDLDLTAEQRDKIKAQRQAGKAKMKELHDKTKAKKMELKAELEKPVIDQAKLAGIVKDLKDISGQKIDERINGILSLRQTLTPEQFRKMHDRMEEKMSKRGDKRRGVKWGRSETVEDE